MRRGPGGVGRLNGRALNPNKRGLKPPKTPVTPQAHERLNPQQPPTNCPHPAQKPPTNRPKTGPNRLTLPPQSARGGVLPDLLLHRGPGRGDVLRVVGGADRFPLALIAVFLPSSLAVSPPRLPCLTPSTLPRPFSLSFCRFRPDLSACLFLFVSSLCCLYPSPSPADATPQGRTTATPLRRRTRTAPWRCGTAAAGGWWQRCGAARGWRAVRFVAPLCGCWQSGTGALLGGD